MEWDEAQHDHLHYRKCSAVYPTVHPLVNHSIRHLTNAIKPYGTTEHAFSHAFSNANDNYRIGLRMGELSLQGSTRVPVITSRWLWTLCGSVRFCATLLSTRKPALSLCQLSDPKDTKSCTLSVLPLPRGHEKSRTVDTRQRLSIDIQYICFTITHSNQVL